MKNYLLKIFILSGFLMIGHFSYSQNVEEQEIVTSQNSEENVLSEEDQNTEEIIPENTPEETEATPTESQIEETQIEIENPAPIPEPVYTPPPIPVKKPVVNPNLTKRKISKKINIDKQAGHSCKPSVFANQIKNGTLQISLLLTKEEGSTYESENLEVGSLPDGINVKIRNSESYTKNISAEENSIPLIITKEQGAQKGSFNIPLVYTVKENGVSSVAVCQFNLVNNG